MEYGPAREQIRPAIEQLHDAAGSHSELVDAVRWNRELDAIAQLDSLNAYLSGFVLGLILQRTDEEVLGREVSRRLSVGVPPDAPKPRLSPAFRLDCETEKCTTHSSESRRGPNSLR